MIEKSRQEIMALENHGLNGQENKERHKENLARKKQKIVMKR